MRLRYPSRDQIKKQKTNWNHLPEIPTKLQSMSGFYLVGLCSEESTGYVCFTNRFHDQIWIEKFSSLIAIDFCHFEMLIKIDDSEEFQKVYQYFQQQGILDGLP